MEGWGDLFLMVVLKLGFLIVGNAPKWRIFKYNEQFSLFMYCWSNSCGMHYIVWITQKIQEVTCIQRTLTSQQRTDQLPHFLTFRSLHISPLYFPHSVANIEYNIPNPKTSKFLLNFPPLPFFPHSPQIPNFPSLFLNIPSPSPDFLYLFHRTMNFSLTHKRNRLVHTISNAELLSYKPYFTFCSPPSSKTLPTTPVNQERQSKMKTTDYKIFKEKYGITEDIQLSCFNLITLPLPTPFITITDLNKLEFPALAYPIKQLVNYSKTIIDSNLERRAIGKSFNLLRLIELIAEHYNITAYHNFTHAFSVLQLLYQTYNRSETLRRCITEKQWFYTFIAALAHDLNHPGTTNAFEVKKKSQLAMEAGNESVLEKMHLNSLWTILKKHSQVNFLQGYCSYQSNEIKKFITRLILSTDVSKHFKGLESLKEFSKSKKTLQGQNSIFIMEQLFHACDIGNPCLNFDNYMNWGALVSFEFDQIAIQEKQLGLEVTGYLKYDNLNKYYTGQIGFCNGLVLPLWRELSLILPGLQQMRENIQKNIKQLQRRKLQ